MLSRHRFLSLLALLCLGGLAAEGLAGDPCMSGLQPGQKWGPYSSIVSLGAERGQSQCFVCDTADRPAVVIFARSLSESLGKLAEGLDKARIDHKAADLRGWITFLSDDQPALDVKVLKWGRTHALRGIPLTIFEDVDGPPVYRLSREADVTVLLLARQKVVANYAFRPGELTQEKVDEVLKALPRIVGDRK